MPLIEERTALFVAVLLHDVAKGRQEDHSIAGARVARKLCPRLGLNEKQTGPGGLADRPASSDVDGGHRTRDLHDRKTITDFATRCSRWTGCACCWC